MNWKVFKEKYDVCRKNMMSNVTRKQGMDQPRSLPWIFRQEIESVWIEKKRILDIVKKTWTFLLLNQN